MTGYPLLVSPGVVRSLPGGARLHDDTRLLEAIEAASSDFRRETRQYISRVVGDTVTLDPEGRRVILLPELPVIDVTALTVDGIPVTPLTGLWSEAGIIRSTTAFPREFRSVTVTYTHGFEPVPRDIQLAVARAAIARSTQPAGVRNATVGPFTVGYGGAGVSEEWNRITRAYKRSK